MPTEVVTEIVLGPAGSVETLNLGGWGRDSLAPSAVVAAEEGADTGPNPIAPESKELYWGAGSFLVLLVLMRLVLFPRVKRGMEERYNGVRGDLEGADAVKASARADVAAYESALAQARAEASARVDAARQTLDAERQAALTATNGRIATMRAEADAELTAARQAVRGQIADAVGAVAARAAEIVTGKAPSPDVVRQSVASAMETGGVR